ncbi:hypothetical protein G6F59_015809 [Rhizopus arrhizus]|nr:hypothetical protein G6F59_015809 [Rhizopus arrhizus]
MHFDARARGVEQRDVAPVVDVEVGVQHLVHMAQQVQVEGGSQVQRVVVSGFQHLPGLDAVHAHQQAAAIALRADALQHGVRVVGAEVADAGSRVEEQPLFRGNLGGQGQRLRKVLPDGGHAQVGIREPQAPHGGL